MKKQIFRKTLCFLFIAAVILGAAVPREAAVYAADAPAQIQNIYTVNGVTYFNVGSKNFSGHKEQYLCDMLGSTNSVLDGANMSDLWLHAAAGIFYETKSGGSQEQAGIAAIAAGNATEESAENFYATRYGIKAYQSFQQAETAVKNYLAKDHLKHYANFATYPGQNAVADDIYDRIKGGGALNNYDSSVKPVLATVLTFAHRDVQSNSNTLTSLAGKLSAVAVYFSDFEIVALFPEDQGNNYVTDVTTSPDSQEKVIASNVKNKTGTTINASQELAQTHSVSAESSVEGSKEYSFSEGLRVGYTHGLETNGLKNEFNLEFEYTATEAFSSGWSESKGWSQEFNASQAISLDLPPYTNVMLKQRSGTTERTVYYNCPVGLKYKATVVFYWIDSLTLKTQLYDFGSDSRTELKKWAVDMPGSFNSYEIDFADLNSKYAKAQEAEQLISSHVPMSSTGAKFTLTIKTVESEVSGLAPIHPLKKIRLAKPEGLSIGSNYSTLEYLKMPMSVGDHDFTSKFELEAFNSLEYEYYGFSKSDGHWIVADEDGNEWADPATCPLEIKGKRFTAVRPGTCFLKFIVDKDTYTWSEDNPKGLFTSPEDLDETAMVEIYISEEASTINIRGDYTGYVGGEPDPLEKDDGLAVIICDGNGKENEDAAYVWEKQESDSRGITLTEDGIVSFTKAGTFHVRAVCNELGITSEWKEITAKGHAHEWGDWETVKEAEEFTEGLEKRVCTRDSSHTETRAIPALGHQLVRTKRKAAGCTEAGNIEYYTCSLCGAIFQDKDSTVEISAGDTVLAPVGHNWDGGMITTPATCENTGVKTVTCLTCGAATTETLKALDHEWSEWTTVKAPSEEVEGEESRSCLNDPTHTQTRAVPPLNHRHTMVKTEKKAATCTEEGNILYYTCSGCGWVFEDFEGTREIDPEDTVIKATGHEWGSWEVAEKATSTKEGTEVRYCLHDREHKETRSIPKLTGGLKTKQFILLKAKKIGKKTITISWTKPEGVTKYVVYAGECEDAYTDTYDINAESRVLKIRKINGEALKSGQYYKFLVVAFGKNAKGKEKEIGRSTAIHVVTKNSSNLGNYSGVTLNSSRVLSLKVGAATTVKAAAKKENAVTVKSHRNMRYYSSDQAVAKVSAKTGKVTAVGAGTCKIYCVAQNGVYAMVRVTVKKK